MSVYMSASAGIYTSACLPTPRIDQRYLSKNIKQRLEELIVVNHMWVKNQQPKPV